MLTLYAFKPSLGVRAPSPFVVKAMALLSMSGLQHDIDFPDVRKMPHKKMPVLKTGDRLIPDSGLIQNYLETEHGIDFDGHLSATELAVAQAFRRMIEHHFYYISAYLRWTDTPQQVRDAYFEDIPAPLRGLVFSLVKKQMLKTCYLQGVSRHSREQMIQFAKDDLDAISDFLGDKDFFFGDKPSSIDAALYGMLHNVIECDCEGPLKDHASSKPNLVAFCQRFGDSFFKDG